MPQAGFEPGSSAATLLEFERRIKPLGHHGWYAKPYCLLGTSTSTNVEEFQEFISSFTTINKATPIIAAK